MIDFIRVFLAEMEKQKKNYYNSATARISSFLWPLIICASTYYSYAVFNINSLGKYGINSQNDLLLFLLLGLWGYNCFWIMVMNARQILKERENGTLEISFLSPASRMALVYGRAGGGRAQNFSMFIIVAALSILLGKHTQNGIIETLSKAFINYIILTFSSIVWGGFINAAYMVSRDVGFWFIVCDAPMNLLSGTNIPIVALPLTLQIMAYLFPLTHCLIIMRSVNAMKFSSRSVILWIASTLAFVMITKIILMIAERYNRETGNLQLY